MVRDDSVNLLRAKRGGRWYENGLRFRCLAPDCVDCCSGKRGAGFVWVSVDEMLRLAAFLRIEFEAFTRKYVRQSHNRYSLIEKPNRDCVFLREGGCSVYDARPGQCRTYPFWPENVVNETAWQTESTQCPGISDASPLVSADEITHQLDEDRQRRGIHVES